MGHVLREPYPYSLEQQIMLADIVVVATFRSVAAGTETMPAPEGEQPTYRPVLIMTFRATEYLKGTGPEEFPVELRSAGYEEYRIDGQRYRGYLTEADALAEATRLTTSRDTKYDNRPGLLFLRGPITPVSPPSDGESDDGTGTRSTSEESTPIATTYGFVLHHRKGSFDYSVDTTSRTWLPAQATGSEGSGETRSTESEDPEFITDGTEDPPPAISLSAVPTRVSEIDAMLREGADKEGWETCIYSKFKRSNYVEQRGETEDLIIQRTLDSGTANDQLVAPRKAGDPGYFVYWTSGLNGELFKGLVIDDDTDPSNGYRYTYVSTRPLPAGSYIVNTHQQHYEDVPCNFKPDDRPIIFDVTVVAPGGTLHEAFFDPVSVGTAVKADGSNGVLSPTSFTVGSTSTDLTRLEWSSNQVVLTLDPHVSLSAHVLDFIALDGSVALSLFTDSATVDSAAGTYSWPMTSQPWADGDQLMVRIREG